RRVIGVRTYTLVFQPEAGIRDATVTGVQTCALPISFASGGAARGEGIAQPEPVLGRDGVGDVGEGRGALVRGHHQIRIIAVVARSEERRVGKGRGSGGAGRAGKSR